MTVKLFILIDVLVFVLLLLIGTSITHKGDIRNVKLSDTVTNLRATDLREREYELFMRGVLGQEPKISN